MVDVATTQATTSAVQLTAATGAPATSPTSIDDVFAALLQQMTANQTATAGSVVNFGIFGQQGVDLPGIAAGDNNPNTPPLIDGASDTNAQKTNSAISGLFAQSLGLDTQNDAQAQAQAQVSGSPDWKAQLAAFFAQLNAQTAGSVQPADTSSSQSTGADQSVPDGQDNTATSIKTDNDAAASLLAALMQQPGFQISSTPITSSTNVNSVQDGANSNPDEALTATPVIANNQPQPNGNITPAQSPLIPGANALTSDIVSGLPSSSGGTNAQSTASAASNEANNTPPTQSFAEQPGQAGLNLAQQTQALQTNQPIPVDDTGSDKSSDKTTDANTSPNDSDISVGNSGEVAAQDAQNVNALAAAATASAQQASVTSSSPSAQSSQSANSDSANASAIAAANVAISTTGDGKPKNDPAPKVRNTSTAAKASGDADTSTQADAKKSDNISARRAAGDAFDRLLNQRDDSQPYQLPTGSSAPVAQDRVIDANAANTQNTSKNAETASYGALNTANTVGGLDNTKLAASVQVTAQRHSEETVSTFDKLGLTIAARSSEGNHQFDIRLDPPDLGRVHVHLTVDDEGQATANLVVDKQQTLDLLQKDSSSLNRALQDAGLNLAQSGLNFSLREQYRQNDNYSGSAKNRSLTAEAVASTETSQSRPIQGSYAPHSVRLDIRV